jgi:hypothetical protein
VENPRRMCRSRGGGTGRRSGLKIPWPEGRVGSIPAPGTKIFGNQRNLLSTGFPDTAARSPIVSVAAASCSGPFSTWSILIVPPFRTTQPTPRSAPTLEYASGGSALNFVARNACPRQGNKKDKQNGEHDGFIAGHAAPLTNESRLDCEAGMGFHALDSRIS